MKKAVEFMAVLGVLSFSLLIATCGRGTKSEKDTKHRTEESQRYIQNDKVRAMPQGSVFEESALECASTDMITAHVSYHAGKVDVLRLSDTDVLQKIDAALVSQDMQTLKVLWEALKNSSRCDLCLHLASNAMESATTAEDKACFASMTLESSMYDTDEDKVLLERALEVLRMVTPQLSPDEKNLRWSIAVRSYCSVSAAVYRDIDKAMHSLEFIKQYLDDTSSAEYARDLVYDTIASHLSHRMNNVKDFRLSENTLQRLRTFADTLDDNYVPITLRNIPTYYDCGERRLKVKLRQGLARYESQDAKRQVINQQP